MPLDLAQAYSFARRPAAWLTVALLADATGPASAAGRHACIPFAMPFIFERTKLVAVQSIRQSCMLLPHRDTNG